MKSIPKILFLLFLSILTISISCSDDDSQECQENNATMMVNGESQSFEVFTYGIVGLTDGYELTIGLFRGSDNPFKQQNILITLHYKKTGKNVIEKFHYQQYIEDISFEGDFTTGEFQSNVTKNSRSCFSTTFSGKLSDGNQEIVITEGKLSYQYPTPFDN